MRIINSSSYFDLIALYSKREQRWRPFGFQHLRAFLCLGICALTGFPCVADEVRISDVQESIQQEAPSTESDQADATSLDDLLNLADSDAEKLSKVSVAAPALQVEVSTVSRQKSTIGRSPAAVFVISSEDIRRSGARSIPDALRLAPGVQVARITASKWAISIRGQNDRFANKLLVQIDGRSVYTPLFGGVYWNVQDVLLEDVKRIEVIRGPGATVWGANAVNGVINIITKTASETQGVFSQAGVGSEEHGFASVRYGGQLSDNAHYRVYGKWDDRDGGFIAGADAPDDWRAARTGFRVDWQADCCNTMTLQGDAYRNYTGVRSISPIESLSAPYSQIVDEDSLFAGGNTLFRWTHTLSDESDWSLQTYLDHTEIHAELTGFREDRNTFDLDFQHRFQWNARNNVIWGFGYRNTRNITRSTPFVLAFNPDGRADDLFSYFVQDEITLREDLLHLVLGAKFQHNDYTGFEFQPTARLLFTPTERHSLWMSFSRAVRTPSHADRSLSFTQTPSNAMPGVYPRIQGNPLFDSEVLQAYEIGIRVQATENFSWDLAAFYFDYDKLRQRVIAGAPAGSPPILPVALTNGGYGNSQGFELAANYEVSSCWSLRGSYSLLGENIVNGDLANQSPVNQTLLVSSWDINCCWTLDAVLRYVDNLPDPVTPHYMVMDIRVAWSPTESLELSVVGRDLLDSNHAEFITDGVTGITPTAVERSVYGAITWRY